MNKNQPSADYLLSGALPENECDVFYHTYTNLSRGVSLFTRFETGRKSLLQIIAGIGEEKSHFRYADGKWSVKEVIGHIMDTERIMAWRSLAFARGDQTHYPGFDQDDYTKAANFDDLQIDQLLNDYRIIRKSTISLFKSFSPDMLMKSGIASNCRFTVRALGFIIAGHELHHIKILKERYLPAIPE
ncbi:DinB family protein [soil metagenome]